MDVSVNLDVDAVRWWADYIPPNEGGSYKEGVKALKMACVNRLEEEEDLFVMEDELNLPVDPDDEQPLPTITIESLGDGQYVFKLRDADDLNTVIREEIGGADMLDTMLDVIERGPEFPVTVNDIIEVLVDLVECGRNTTSGAVYATQDDWDMVERAAGFLHKYQDYFDE